MPASRRMLFEGWYLECKVLRVDAKHVLRRLCIPCRRILIPLLEPHPSKLMFSEGPYLVRFKLSTNDATLGKPPRALSGLK